ncbi:tetratricopeptide repeat protein [Nostoc sp. UHCC 0870]|uniref:tetratricopeptide repeat protein n=1 Tax=Nostoc sp. UHCC 0870 TaxID=2914041 RepID=UPI001EDEDADE|nr:tetratricopeptide repeat protein [Nostoc sp. UHCC 0870]UKP00242.1 tetratricopeptide repeat protein [Nostoc sp. UHCC 0870]
MLGNTLVGRYQIINNLGGGGFGETFVASDTHLPGSPKCVVKKLQPQSQDKTTLEIARRLFDTEAQVLYKLGTHDRIPQLLAYFEENAEFYLVQELVPGYNLSQEITPGKSYSQGEVMTLLQEILTILEFVHQQNVIHRDVNPRNILRREDGNLVLIDFGAVKQITTQIINTSGQPKSTVVIGTPGYIPGEQAQGKPKFSSDIYAVGIIAIQALTGLSASQIEQDSETNEIIWRDYVTVSPEFADFMDKMVCYDFRQRYSTATAALAALKELTQPSSHPLAVTPTLAPKKFNFLQNKKGILLKILLAILLMGVTGVAAVFILNSVTTNNATELSNKGNTFFELQRYEDALGAYRKAVNIRPDFPQAWQGKAKTLTQLQQYQAALTAYDKAIQLQPDYLEAWTGRGSVLQKLQRYQEAIASFDKALKIKNNSPEIWHNKGEVFNKLKQYDNAIKAYNQALALKPDDYIALYNQGLILQNLKQYDEAIAVYNKAVEIQPNYVGAWYNLGNSLVNLNRYEDAIKAYDKVVKYNANYYAAWLSKGNVLIILRRYPEAIETFNQVLKGNQNNYQAWYGKGWSLHQTQSYAEAIEAYNQAAKIQPKNYQVWYSLGNSQYNLQQYENAIASYSQAVRHKPNHYESWYSRGNALFNLQRHKEAIASYNQAIKYKPNDQPAINALNEAQTQLDAATPQPIVIPTMPTPQFTMPGSEN